MTTTRLDRYDARATAAVAAAGVVYAAHVAEIGVLDSARATALGVLVAGVSACAQNGSRSAEVLTGTYANVMAFFGAMAAVLGISAVVSGAEGALIGEVVVVAGLWLVTTIKHLRTEPEPVPAPEEQRTLVSRR